MSTSLTEMVIAIAILGLIMTGAIATTSKTLVRYQATDASIRESTAHEMAARRAERIVGSIWRGADPPAGYGDLTTAKTAEIEVGQWRFREWSNVLQQEYAGGTLGDLAENASGFSFSFLLDDGTWATGSLNASKRSVVTAVKFSWTDSATGREFGAWCVPPDRQYSYGVLSLRSPDSSGYYNRSDHESQVNLSLGVWP